MKSVLSISVLLLVHFSSVAQILKIEPYLEDAEPNHVHISWMTDSNTESIVDYGTTIALGNSTTGGQFTTLFGDVVHETELIGLSPNTKYYYRVITGSLTSETYDFTTPALSSSEASFNLIAMSDMQIDGAHPEIFSEIVNQGIIPVVNEKYGELSENIGFVLVPGDLVVNGLNYDSWRTQFFNPAANLLSHVPIYPVLGNHENNADYYFDFFHLPENGSPGFEEHWWYKDYSNVRIIGLNSNGTYANATQLAWLQDVLDETCASDSIDFVFAQLHHPHESELWTPGESGYSTTVVEYLEDFTSNCGKPSIHFFGHTHGYSRGQRKDHEHVMVNVASAGGALDHWGEWPQNDYQDFTVSHAEYGFVIVEIDAGDDPKFVLKRYSRGSTYNPLNNVLKDSIEVKLNNLLPATPAAVSPVGVTVNPNCLLLVGSPFQDSDGHGHMASEWQIDTNSDFSAPIYESYQVHENWYFFEDTQAGEILIDEKVQTAPENSTLYWRVRYRDQSLGWSDWSTPTQFFTGTSLTSPNLAQNPGAENGTSNWTVVSGNLESLTAGECDGTSPNTGNYYYGVGGLCIDGAYGEAYQDIDLSAYETEINEGDQFTKFGAWMSDFNGADIPEYLIEFRDVSNQVISTSESVTSSASSWTYYESNVQIPVGTTSIRFILKGTRNAGADNDSYVDDVFLYVGGETCDDSNFDEDEDGIVDSTDNCLDLVNEDQADFNNDGIGDACDDFDGDGILDTDEILIYMTDPNNEDSDADGINDYEEIETYGTNPLLQDSDYDGLTDELEINTSMTDPNNPDTDNDGCTDDLYFGMLCFGQGDTCPVDTNNDGVINVLDLVNISSAFGTLCE